MPKDANKKTALKMCKTVREQITCGANLGLPLIATTTINNRLTNLGVVFSFAAKHGYIHHSPVVETLKVKNNRETADLIDNSFSDAEMTRIIKLCDKRLAESSDDNDKWKAWIPLVIA